MDTDSHHSVLVSDPLGAHKKALIILHISYTRMRFTILRENNVPPFSLICLNLNL
jgi:hypothetical protein